MSDADRPIELSLEQKRRAEAERAEDHLRVGDIIQEWRTKRVGGVVVWRWVNGEVLAVAEKPCGGSGASAWVALIQWSEGRRTLGWSALPQHEWGCRIEHLRRKPAPARRSARPKSPVRRP